MSDSERLSSPVVGLSKRDRKRKDEDEHTLTPRPHPDEVAGAAAAANCPAEGTPPTSDDEAPDSECSPDADKDTLELAAAKEADAELEKLMDKAYDSLFMQLDSLVFRDGCQRGYADYIVRHARVFQEFCYDREKYERAKALVAIIAKADKHYATLFNACYEMFVEYNDAAYVVYLGKCTNVGPLLATYGHAHDNNLYVRWKAGRERGEHLRYHQYPPPRNPAECCLS